MIIGWFAEIFTKTVVPLRQDEGLNIIPKNIHNQKWGMFITNALDISFLHNISKRSIYILLISQ